MGKIADAFVEIKGDSKDFSKAINGLSALMEMLEVDARSLSKVADQASNSTGGIASRLLEVAATGLKVYLTYTTAARVYAVAAASASVINPFASVTSNAASIASEGMKTILALAARIPPKFLAAAAAVGVLGVAYLTFRSSVARASDLQETMDFSRTVLGAKGFETASKAADQLSWSYGVLRKETIQTATTAASMAKNLGLSRDQAAELGIQVARLAADLSSANNTTMADAAEAINASFRGELDPAERYGASLVQANIEAEALASNLARTKGEIDDNVKFQARWNLLIKQTADSQGNLSSTAGSLANVIRNVKGQFAEASTIIGEAFLPLAGTGARAMLALASAIRVAATGFSYIVAPIGYVADEINKLHDSVMRLTGGKKEGFKLFEATAAENEAKRIKRFQQELADEQAKHAQEAADLQLKMKNGLLTDADRKKMAEAAEEEAKTLRDAWKQRRDMEADQERTEKQMIDAQEKNETAIRKSTEAEKERIGEMIRGFNEVSARKQEDMDLDRQRRAEDRAAAMNFLGSSEAADRLFMSAVTQGREDKRSAEDAANDFIRRQEDLARAADDVRKQGSRERDELRREGSLTQRGLSSEVDRIVKALEAMKMMWGMT